MQRPRCGKELGVFKEGMGDCGWGGASLSRAEDEVEGRQELSHLLGYCEEWAFYSVG